MHAEAPQPDHNLPPLAPLHERLVLALILNDFEILQSAADCAIDPATALALSTRPDIAAYLAADRALHNARLERQALSTLARLLHAPRNPSRQTDHHNTEARRSATTILRAIRHNPATTTPPTPHPTSPTRKRGPNTSPAQPARPAHSPPSLDALMPTASAPSGSPDIRRLRASAGAAPSLQLTPAANSPIPADRRAPMAGSRSPAGQPSARLRTSLTPDLEDTPCPEWTRVGAHSQSVDCPSRAPP